LSSILTRNIVDGLKSLGRLLGHSFQLPFKPLAVFFITFRH
jgi:hypothetical protein